MAYVRLNSNQQETTTAELRILLELIVLSGVTQPDVVSALLDTLAGELVTPAGKLLFLKHRGVGIIHQYLRSKGMDIPFAAISGHALDWTEDGFRNARYRVTHNHIGWSESCSSSSQLPPGLILDPKLHIRATASPVSGGDVAMQTPSSASFPSPQSVHLVQPVTSLSISPNGNDAVLAAKKGLYIVNLEQLHEPPRVIHHMTNWEVSDVQWNPHRARAYWIATTSNQKALVWNLETSATGQADGSSKHIQYILGSHQRAVSDLNWSPAHPDLLATCSYDSYVHLWDLRTPTEKPGTSFCGWTAGATQVKFNRLNEHLLASSHDTDVKIWDIRKGSTPVTMITAHMTKIYGIDWSRNNEDEIITCSQDRLVKFWDINCPRNCQATIMTGSPVWRARFTPFGNGIVTMPQRKETNLLLWNVANLSAPVYSFEGHTDVPREFVWRVRGGADERMADDTSFELVTWSKDQHLRLWPIKPEIIRSVGQDVFRTDSPTPDYSEMRSPSRAAAHRRAVSEPMSGMPFSSSSPAIHDDPTAPASRPPYLQSSSASSLLASESPDHTEEWVQSSRYLEAGESPDANLADDSARASEPWTLGREIADAMRDYPDVQFEKVDLIKRQCTITLQSGRNSADNVPTAALTAAALVDAPPVQAAFLRLDVSFSQHYPHRAAPVFTFQKTGMVSMANRRCLAAKISQIATSCARRSEPCLGRCLKYLLCGEIPSPPSPSCATTAALPGTTKLPEIHATSIYSYTGIAGPHSTEPAHSPSTDTVHQRTMVPPAPIPDFDSDLTTSSDSDASPATADSALLIGRKKLQDKRLLKEVIVGTESRNVPFPRLCGASFSPNGQLVYFFSSLPHPSTTRFTAYSLVTRNQQPVLQSQHFTTQPRTYSLYENYRAFVLTKFPKTPFLAANPPRDHHQLHHHPAAGASWGAPNVPADAGIIAPTSERGNDAKGKFSYWLDSDESGEDSVPAAMGSGPPGFLWGTLPPQSAPHEPRKPSVAFGTSGRPMSSPAIRTSSGLAPRASVDPAVHSRTQSLMVFDPMALLSSTYCAPPTTPSSRGGSPDLEYHHPAGIPALHRSLTTGGAVGLTVPIPPQPVLLQASPPPPSKSSPSMRFGAVRPIATSSGGARSTTPTPLATSPTPTRRIIAAQASHHHHPLPHRPGGGRRRATSIDMGSVSGGSDFGGSEVPSSFEDRNMGAYMERHANAAASGVAGLLPSFHFPRDGEALSSAAVSLASSPMDSHSDLVLPAPTAPPPPAPRELGIVVHRRNINELLPVSQRLAQAYTLSGDDPVEICTRNGAAASDAQRPDLVQIWTLAALLLRTQCEKPNAEDGEAGGHDSLTVSTNSKRAPVIDPRTRRPRRRRADASSSSDSVVSLSKTHPRLCASTTPPGWQWHPFGRQMVQSLFAHCRRQGDVQTLAMLVCVFSHRFAKVQPLNAAAGGGSSVYNALTAGGKAGGRALARAMVVEQQQLAQANQPAAPSNPNRQPSQSYFRQQISSTAAAGSAMVATMITPPLSAAFSMMGVGVSNVIRTLPDSDTVTIQLTSLTKDSGGSSSVGSGKHQRAAGWLRASTTSAAASSSSNRPSFESLGRHFHHPSMESWTSGGTGTPPTSTTPGGPGWGDGTPVGSYAGDSMLVGEHVGGSTRPDGSSGLKRSNTATYAQAASGGFTTPPLGNQSRPHPARNMTTPTTAAASPAVISTQSRMPGMHRQRSQDAWIGTGHYPQGRNSQHLEPKKHRDSAPPSPRPQAAATSSAAVVATSGWTLTAPLASVMHAQPPSAPHTPGARRTPPATTFSAATTAMSTPSLATAATSSTMPAILMLRLTEDEDAERPAHPHERPLSALLPSSLAVDGLLDRGDAAQHRAWCRGYAEMLYTWGFAEQRAEILKCVLEITPSVTPPNGIKPPMTTHVGVEFGTVCSGCGTHLTPQTRSTPPSLSSSAGAKTTTPPWSYCWRCDRKRYGLSACAVCNLPARGLAAFCAVCAHGGCAGCLRRWFEEEEVCARGCGCQCRALAGGCLSGM
ncbi:hypothetical protein HDU86_002735 [Geranomyces michiganensis]|nr:hypothetical protein HDU86_002735 [Geranomyces michiganensis]